MFSPEEIESLEILGHVYFRQGKLAEARTVFEGILAVEPANPIARRHLAALALEKGDGEDALRHLEFCSVTREDGKREEAVPLLRAQALRLAGRAGEAERIFRNWLEAPRA